METVIKVMKFLIAKKFDKHHQKAHLTMNIEFNNSMFITCELVHYNVHNPCVEYIYTLLFILNY